MHASRRMACLLFVANATAWAQIPPGADPAQPYPAPREQPAQTAATPGGPGASGGPPLQLPHQGHLQNAPTSAASARFAHLPAVAIREFRSSVSEITARGATDMFISALVKTRKFRVLERARIAEGIAAEKALNQQGMTTGQLGQSQYTGAAYLFEATISEASAGDSRSSFTLGLAGAAAGRGSSSDSIAIDVRVTDVESGVVVDAVTVRKALKTVETKVAGVTSALANVFTRGRGSALADALAPNDEYVSARRDNVDKALREAIDEAVSGIAKRFVNE